MGIVADSTRTIQQDVNALAEHYGLRVTAKVTQDWNPQTGEFDGKAIDATVTVQGTFEADDTEAYLRALDGCQRVLSIFRAVRPGSTWGTDSASVGGHAGLTGGYCELSKSGVGIRLARRFV